MAARSPTNREIADRLQLLGDLLEIDGAVRHRVLAYRRAAARVRGHHTSVAELARAGRATELPDIGATLQDKIVELVTTGDIGALRRLAERVPEGLAAIAALAGVGPKRAMAMHAALGVRDLAELEEAARAGRLRDVPGLGPGLERGIAAQLGRAPAPGGEDRVERGRALSLAEAVAADLRAADPHARVEVAGSLRRGKETIGDIDIVAGTRRPGELHAALRAHPAAADVRARGDAHTAVLTHAGLRLELLTAEPEAFGDLLQHATGSAAHNVRLRAVAVRRGLSMSQYGIRGPDGGLVRHAEEDAVYAALGMPWVPPELREDVGEVEAALEGRLPRLVTADDLRGELHAHTDWSDGKEPLARMVEHARARGYEYLAISDHSQSLSMAGGLDPDRVRRQWEAIDAINARHDDIRVLKATELDILPDGRLDFDDELLAGFDWVTASLHGGFGQAPAQLTDRLLTAIESPHVDAIGHPTARMLGRRPHAPIDLPRVIAAAARTGTYLEVNGQPRRLDLDSRMARAALAGGARLVLGADAHSGDGLDYARLAVTVARRAGARPEDVANTRPFAELAAMRAAAQPA